VQGILFAAGAVAVIVGVVFTLESWTTWGEQTSLPLHVKFWGWVAIAVLPLFAALFRFGKSFVPVGAAVLVAAVLPWCSHTLVVRSNYPQAYPNSYTQSEPTIFAHALVAAFAIFLIWWGVRQASKALVNLGIVGFAITVVWFYFSNILDKFGRSLGLIGLGILFLAGGWALERMRRRLIAQMSPSTAATEVVQ
jgi:uncharacterized membrane protein